MYICWTEVSNNTGIKNFVRSEIKEAILKTRVTHSYYFKYCNKNSQQE